MRKDVKYGGGASNKDDKRTRSSHGTLRRVRLAYVYAAHDRGLQPSHSSNIAEGEEESDMTSLTQG